ncbi:MAG TPA: GDYXXLXY domain-containing protein [Lacipirellulaceae bacterium]|jgi:uncharacterized membrane-anchored protein
MADTSQRRSYDRPFEIPWLASGLDWLSMHALTVLAVGAILQLMVLLTMIVSPLATLMTGEPVLLRVVPVDPRDLFRGDYVILGYEFSRPSADGSAPTAVTWNRLAELRGKTLYVRLETEEDGKHWRSVGYELEPPSSGKFIRGVVTPGGTVQYGIESYFVEEGKGHDYEQAVRDHKLSAEVLIDSSGAAQLRRLIIE